MKGEKLGPAEGEATVCGTFVETDDATGLAPRIEPVRVGRAAGPGDAGGVAAAHRSERDTRTKPSGRSSCHAQPWNLTKSQNRHLGETSKK